MKTLFDSDFNLDRDLIFFDIEATGLNVLRDRIIQIAFIKYRAAGGPPEEWSLMINPGVPIPPESTAVHGFTDADVENSPGFAEVASQIHRFIDDCDLAGYNSNRFDVPLLIEEFARAGYPFETDGRRLIDVQRIFYKMEPRTLSAAYRFYCNKKLENAHDALADVRATAEVLKGQIEKYEGMEYEDEDGNTTVSPIKNDMQSIHDFTNDSRILDATQRIRLNEEGVAVFNFGRYINQPVGKTMYEDQQYYQWMLNKEFSVQVKRLIKKEFERFKAEVERL